MALQTARAARSAKQSTASENRRAVASTSTFVDGHTRTFSRHRLSMAALVPFRSPVNRTRTSPTRSPNRPRANPNRRSTYARSFGVTRRPPAEISRRIWNLPSRPATSRSYLSESASFDEHCFPMVRRALAWLQAFRLPPSRPARALSSSGRLMHFKSLQPPFPVEARPAGRA